MKQYYLTVFLVVVCATPATAQTLTEKLKAEGNERLAEEAREKGDALRGSLLFPLRKLGCAGCHSPGGRVVLGPDLAAIAKDVPDAHLVESLLYPSKVVKQGFEAAVVTTQDGKIYTGKLVRQTPFEIVLRESSEGQRRLQFRGGSVEDLKVTKQSYMPDGLVDQLENRQQFLDLVRYLIEIRGTRPSAGISATDDSSEAEVPQVLQGLAYLDAYQCFACHQRGSMPDSPSPKQAPDLAWSAGRIDPAYLERFLRDPLKVKPGTTMPDVMASHSSSDRRSAARELTHYVVSLGNRNFQRQALDSAAAERGRTLFHTVGCVACHSPRDDAGNETLQETSIALGSLTNKYNRDGLVAFLKNPHQVRRSGRMPNLQLTHWEAVDLSNYLLHSTAEPPTESTFELDPDLVARGQTKFQELGCVQCHATTQTAPRELPELTAANSSEGCLSDSISSWPQYDLTTSERSAMRAAIAQAPSELDVEQQIVLTLATFNCIACHERDGLGGISLERDVFFQTENPNLGPQGRRPPRLTNVGAKLQPRWLRQVLVSGRSIRPYMKTRMPQYGAANVAHLVDLFHAADRNPEVTFGRIRDRKEARTTGHELAGTRGLNCIACHNFRQKPAATMPAVDLTEMSERLQKEWFYRYMKDPQRLSPGTVMPSFWPGGRAIRKEILEGDPNQQVEALWQYLAEGRQARPPRGLIRKPIELLATDEAVMLRRSYPGIGKRGIGVGYPGGVNLAFDAEQMRLAMIWQGKFADPAGVWRSQGHGQVRPLGRKLLRLSPGPELEDSANPWVVDEGRPPHHKFRGYVLDKLRRPTFLYRFGDVHVEDYPVDVHDKTTGSTYLRRTLTFSAKEAQPRLAFRVAAGKSIEQESEHTYLIDNALQVRIAGTNDEEIRDTENGKVLRVPLDLGAGKAQLVLEYAW